MHDQPEWVESELCHSHQELLELRWEVVSEGGDVEITDRQDQDHGKASGTSRGWEIPMGLFEESLSSLPENKGEKLGARRTSSSDIPSLGNLGCHVSG